jgi:hypothetical protein
MRSLILGGIAAALLFSNTPARAQEVSTRSTFVGPDPALFWGGLVVAAAPYIGGVPIAADSDRSMDHFLYAPIVGPWLDLGQRSGCFKSVSCSEETFDVLLIADGLLQAVGAASIVTSFVLPSRYRVRAQLNVGEIHFAPLMQRSSGGFGAFGTF